MPLYNLLQVEGAAGQLVPYLGYVEMTIGFHKEFLGEEFDVPTLALVVPDGHPEGSSVVLIGMNTLEPLYEQYIRSDISNFQPRTQGYCAVLKLLQLKHQQNQVGRAGTVKLLSQTPVLIPSGQTIVLEGSARIDSPTTVQWAVIEHPRSSLPGGLCVQSCLITFPTHAPYKVPVLVTNESEQGVLIPPMTVIADIGTSPTILGQHTVNTSPVQGYPQRSTLELNFGESPIPSEWKERVTFKLNQMPEVFSYHDLDFGCTDQVKHHIKLHDETAFKHRARPIHPRDLEAVRSHLRDLLEADIIRESESPFASPIVVVRKRNGDVRLCIDYRKLNLQTVKDAYALPNLEESFSALTGSRWFTVLDLKSGYYQIQMSEADKAKTAFVTPLGFWEWNRMPQGVTNAPSTFQRLMEKCMGDLNLKEALVFLDDIIIFSDTLEEHEKRLLRVLNRLKEFGLKLSPEKCKFFQSSVRYLGHVVSEKGVETDPEKISALKSWPVPRNLKELRSFLGFAGYYRRFIKDYATIVKPLNGLTRGYAPICRSIKNKSPAEKFLDPKQSFGERWTSDCQVAFDTVISKLTSAPVLGFANPKLPYILHTDASILGLGAVLYQEQNDQLRVIAYASRGLSQSESRYPAHKLEFLALKWSVTEKFHDYLYGADFTVVTDNNPLTYVLTSAKLDATSHRWLAALSTYSFKMQYRAGKHNFDADALSRRYHGEVPDRATSCEEWELVNHLAEQLCGPGEVAEISPDIVAAICQSSLIRSCCSADYNQLDVTLVESLSIHANIIPDCFAEEESHGLPVISPLTHTDLKEEQRADPAIREVIYQLETGEKVSSTVREELPELPLLLREWNRLQLEDGVLYRRRQDEDKLVLQLVLPPVLRPTILKSLHSDMGHMGIERTLDLVRQRFFWPKMAANVENFIKTCGRCVRRKTFPQKAAPLVNIQTSRPLELVCMDFLSLEPDSSNTKNILVLTDHFTKFAVAIPTANQKAKTVARCLWNDFMVCYGFPERLHSDQGPDFESKLIKELCDVAGIKKTRTTPYHPRGNPVERFNRTLLNMLGTLESKQKTKWREYVKPLVHAYNCTRNEVTGFTPYELLFGRSPRLPVDLAFGLPVRDSPSPSHSQYVKDLRSRLEESYKLTCQNAQKSAKRNKSRFDQRVKPASLDVGDRVLVRNVRIRGKHKLEDKWEQEVYVVVDRAGDLPVYVVRPENKGGPNRTLHRDLLLPCGFLSASVTEDFPEDLPAKKPHTRSQSHNRIDQVDIFQDEDTEDADLSIFRSPPQFPMKFSVERVSGCVYEPMTDDIVGLELPTASSDGDSVPLFPHSPVATSFENHLPEVEESFPITGEASSTSSCGVEAPVKEAEVRELGNPVLDPISDHVTREMELPEGEGLGFLMGETPINVPEAEVLLDPEGQVPCMDGEPLGPN
ncbi:interleukin-1 receptor accessory protein-like 1-A [Pimephales promelas]|nr:interleukin-1 receptor accessory protein-like 1-A [Pimephales promelas]